MEIVIYYLLGIVDFMSMEFSICFVNIYITAICTLLVVVILYATFLPYQALDMVNLLTLLLDVLPSLCLSSQQSKSMLLFLNCLIFVYFYINIM